MPEQKTEAFISYCRDDSEFALRLAQDLKAAGARVWIDQLDIIPGHNWDNAIEDALMNAEQMLLILSPASAKSENVRDEISYALQQGKIVIPVLYQDCVVPLRLQRKQRIDFRADYTRGLTALLDQLRVPSPDPSVLRQAEEDESRRQLAWQARDAEAKRLRELGESEGRARRDQEDALAAEARHKEEEARQLEEAHRKAAEEQRKAAEALRKAEVQQKLEELQRIAAKEERRKTEEAQQKVEAARIAEAQNQALAQQREAEALRQRQDEQRKAQEAEAAWQQSMSGQPVPEPPRLTSWQRFAFIFLSPRKTFVDIRRNGSWWLPFLAIIGAATLNMVAVLSLASGYFRRTYFHTLGTSILATFIETLASGALCLVMLKYITTKSSPTGRVPDASGPQSPLPITYSKITAVFWYSQLPYAIPGFVYLFTSLLHLSRIVYFLSFVFYPISSIVRQVHGQVPFAVGLLLDNIGPIRIWTIILECIGVSVVGRIRGKSAIVIVMLCWLLSTVIGLCLYPLRNP